MKVQRFLPSDPLSPFVKEFMIIENELETDKKIIPDASIIMAFRYRGSMEKLDEGGKEVIPPCVITGLRRSARQLYYSRQTANLLVVLKEGGLAAFSGIPAQEWFGLMVSAENLFLPADLNEVLERLAEAKTDRDRIDNVEAFLLGRLTDAVSDPLIEQATRLIKMQKGMIRIRELAFSQHLSQDAFEKRFRTIVGSTPKQYASIIRLRSLIVRYPSYPSLTAASYDAGYFDQSHFIKDFRLFTGQSPKEFFQSPRLW